VPSEIRRVRILLSSPGNLSEDRKVIREVVDTINRDSGQRLGFHAEVVGWETHSRPAAGEYPQAVINEQFPKDIDIFVGLLGAYFGRPTKKYNSGTEEEFYVAHESFLKTGSPQIMFYFSSQADSLDKIDPKHLALVIDFKERIGELGVYYFGYRNELDLRLDLHPQLSAAIHEALENEATETNTGAADESLRIFPNLEALLASDPSVAASDLFDSASTALETHTKLQNRLTQEAKTLTQKILRALRTINSDKLQRQKEKAASELLKALTDYQSAIRPLMPKKERAFIDAMTSVQRAVTLIKDNDLASTMPYKGLIEPVSSTIVSFAELQEILIFTTAEIEKWPEVLGGISVQKKVIVAVHKDLIEYYGNMQKQLQVFLENLRI
jgi:hypothetical protein